MELCDKIRTNIRAKGRGLMSSIRFFHTADLHLDSPFKGLTYMPEERLAELRNSTFQAFDHFIQYAINEHPDFIVIVGDIYDGEDRSLRAQSYFQHGMEQLYEHNIPVIISYGNHDHLKGKWTRFKLPPNVIVMPKETTTATLTIRGTTVHIYGFSYAERHVTESKIAAYPVATEQDAIHIGMLHGSLAGDKTHDVYAPFTREELLSKNYDYWALGHIHQRQTLHTDPPIIYPGNMQSRHRKECGIKGFYDVSIENFAADLTFVPTSAIVYDAVIVDCSNLLYANEVLQACEEALEGFRDEFGAGVVEVHLQNINEQGTSLFEDASITEWLELIREREDIQSPTVWVESLQIDTTTSQSYEPTVATETVLQVMQNWDAQHMKEILKELYQHTKGSRYLEPLSEEDLQEISKEAQHLFKQTVSTNKG